MSIEAKIAKLLAMADHSTSNPHEAANAAARAAELAASHNVDLDALRRSRKQIKEFVEQFGLSNFPVRDMNAMGLLLKSVGQLYGVSPMLWDRRRPPMSYSFSGQEQNIKMAVHWVEYLWTTCKRANTEHARERQYGSARARDEARSTFRYWFCYEVHKRLLVKFNEMTEPAESVTGTALVVSNWLKTELAEVAVWAREKHPNSKVRSGPQARNIADAAIAGSRAGKAVSIQDQLG